ncbi:cupin domain-containing protein [Roseomonas chloroacetimidivorans]|jgi:quercetin dioxygenase-like cupin family protein|uniref:cupin domain-containing protein n=1 Tax=Roseomonas chloroacetimidivorans TaxID=1766656 RepID=UPI003C79639C
MHGFVTFIRQLGLAAPRPVAVRAQSILARHYFPEHAHRWNQVGYAISGVLTVPLEGRSFVISPEQAVWLRTGLSHRVGSLSGRSSTASGKL